MKKPEARDLHEDLKETQKIRSLQKKIKITINIDAEILSEYKSIAEQTGVPYQRLINRKLKESLESEQSLEDRLKEIEKEIRKLKKALAA